MVSPCYNHAAVSSAGSCVQCGMPFCQECLEPVAGRPVCKRCLPAMKARIEQQMASAPPPYPTAPPQGNYPGYAPPVGGPPPYAAAAAAEPSSAKQMVLGIGLSLIIGIAAAVVIEKLLLYTGFGLSLLYVLMGYGIGWGLHRIMGRGGSGLALVAVGVMVASLGVSHLVYAQDLLNKVGATHSLRAGVTALDVFPIVIQSLGPMHWVCIAFGLLACYRGVESQQP